MTNMESVSSPGFTVKRYCEMVFQQKKKQIRWEDVHTFPETTTESCEKAKPVNPFPPVAVLTGFESVPSVSEIWRAMMLLPAWSSS